MKKLFGFIWALLMAPRVVLANEAGGKLIGLANEVSDGEWIQLTPKGDFKHPEGIQRIDDESLKTMENSFRSLAGKMGRRFGGAPVFIGHPDVKQFANEYPDKKSYAWVQDVEARSDGLYGRMDWSEPGKELIKNKHYRFHSPVFDGKEIGVENGRKVYRPVRFISAGLTNTPRLPVPALANESDADEAEETKTKEREMKLEAVAALVGLANTATEQEVTAKINELSGAAGKVTTLSNEKSTADTALNAEKTEHGKTKAAAEAAIKQRNTIVLDNAVRAGQITPADREATEKELNADFEGTVKKLANSKGMKTESRLKGAGHRRVTLSNDEDQAMRQRGAKVKTLVNEKLSKGMSYDDAYRAVRLENAALFEEMIEPEAAEGAQD